MSNVINWQLQSNQRELERWARIRADGHALYIVNGTVSFGLFIMLMNDIIDNGIGIPAVLIAHLFGAVIAWLGWRDMESKYQKALLNAYQKAPAISTNILGLRDS